MLAAFILFWMGFLWSNAFLLGVVDIVCSCGEGVKLINVTCDGDSDGGSIVDIEWGLNP